MKVAYKNVLDTMIEEGAYIFGETLDSQEANEVYKKALSIHEFGPNLFLSEEEYKADPIHKGVNPRKGRNLAEKFDLSFVEKDLYLQDIIAQLLGRGLFWFECIEVLDD